MAGAQLFNTRVYLGHVTNLVASRQQNQPVSDESRGRRFRQT
jgi:hypothetical protein